MDKYPTVADPNKSRNKVKNRHLYHSLDVTHVGLEGGLLPEVKNSGRNTSLDKHKKNNSLIVKKLANRNIKSSMTTSVLPGNMPSINKIGKVIQKYKVHQVYFPQVKLRYSQHK